MVRYLVKETSIDRRTKNSRDQTPLQILKETLHYSGSKKTANDKKIKKLLKFYFSTPTTSFRSSPRSEWLAKKRDAIMVVAILIATMAFQVAVNSPGGVWQQEETPPEGTLFATCSKNHSAGESVMACEYRYGYRMFLISNTVAFVTSLSTILLLISGLPFRRGIFMWGLMVIMWAAVTALGLTYVFAIYMVTPALEFNAAVKAAAGVGIIVWLIIMAILLVGNTLRLLTLWFRRRWEQLRRFFINRSSSDSSSSALNTRV